MFNVGDKIKIGSKTGRIVRVNQDKRIGFLAETHRTPTYNIIIEGVSEDDLKVKKNGTGTTSNKLSEGKKAKSD